MKEKENINIMNQALGRGLRSYLEKNTASETFLVITRMSPLWAH